MLAKVEHTTEKTLYVEKNVWRYIVKMLNRYQ